MWLRGGGTAGSDAPPTPQVALGPVLGWPGRDPTRWLGKKPGRETRSLRSSTRPAGSEAPCLDKEMCCLAGNVFQEPDLVMCDEARTGSRPCKHHARKPEGIKREDPLGGRGVGGAGGWGVQGEGSVPCGAEAADEEGGSVRGPPRWGEGAGCASQVRPACFAGKLMTWLREENGRSV